MCTQDGINWLGFLNKYNLHGILCDDMGLGKTLQSLCVLATDTHRRTTSAASVRHAAGAGTGGQAVISLVVCPPTVTGHWMCEVERFVDKEYINPLHYTGPPVERKRYTSRVDTLATQ